MSEMTSNNPNGGAADVIEEPVVQIHGLHKAYGDNVVLRGIDLDVHRGEVVVVLGPSGSGKSTMLRCVNLLETPTSGSIVVEGVDITKKGVDINKVRSTLGMVFQQFNLFPHLSAKRNVMIAQQKGAQALQGGSRVHRREGACKGWPCRPRGLYALAAIRRPAAARRHRPRACHESARHAV